MKISMDAKSHVVDGIGAQACVELLQPFCMMVIQRQAHSSAKTCTPASEILGLFEG